MTIARECTGKQAHATKAEALDHAFALRRRLPATRSSANAYHCRHCSKWHVGHRPRRRR